MAKKNGETIEGEAPVKKAPAAPDDRYRKLQAERRELEVELAAIDVRLRSAINAGDLGLLNEIAARKAELPRLFIAASTAETTARRDFFNAEDAANLERLAKAESELEKVQSAISKRQREYESDMAVMRAHLQEVETLLGEITGDIAASRNLGAAGEAGFKRSLASLVEV